MTVRGKEGISGFLSESAKIRNLLPDEQYKHIFQGLPRLPLLINSLIELTNDNLKT
ncbi:hypothetical protein [Rufibacter latericius]|uniref:hypothetical protein n=1 Tax=Rufibacter latericius TaxID=2487040 RepID=UPI001402A145|nr:hypothetical protein [Rufibacter latericius]